MPLSQIARAGCITLFVFGALSACMPTLSSDDATRRGFLSGLDRPDSAENLLQKRALANGAVVIKAPKHYCVDPSVVGSADFALLAECGTLKGAPAQHPKDRGIMTVSTSAPIVEGALPNDLAPALGTGESYDSRVKGFVIKRIQSADETNMPGADPKHWRGALLVNDRLVTFAVYGPKGGAVTGDSGRRLLEELARNTQRASRAR